MSQIPDHHAATEHSLYLKLFVTNGGGW